MNNLTLRDRTWRRREVKLTTSQSFEICHKTSCIPERSRFKRSFSRTRNTYEGLWPSQVFQASAPSSNCDSGMTGFVSSVQPVRAPMNSISVNQAEMSIPSPEKSRAASEVAMNYVASAAFFVLTSSRQRMWATPGVRQCLADKLRSCGSLLLRTQWGPREAFYSIMQQRNEIAEGLGHFVA